MRNTLQVNDHITTDSKEHKEIFVDINTNKNITIGGTNSTVVTGGNLRITQDVFSGQVANKSMFSDMDLTH